MHGVCAESISGDETARWELVPGAPGRAGHSCTSWSLLVPERHWLQGLVPQPEGKDLLKAEAWRLSLAVTHQSSRGFVAQMPPCRSSVRAVGWTFPPQGVQPDAERLEQLRPLPLLPVAPLLGGWLGWFGLEG